MKNKITGLLLVLLLSVVLIGCKTPTYNMSGVSFEDTTVYYDGTSKNIYIEGDLPNGVSVTYENNGHSDIGTYEVKAHFTGDSKHKEIPSKTATLTILKNEEEKLPDLTSKNEDEITQNLNKLGFTNIEFIEVFNVKTFKGRFIGYQDYQIEQFANTNNKVIVQIATRALPDITKIYTEDIEEFFLNAGVSKSNIVGIPQMEGDPEFGLGYHELEVGQDYTTGPIKYLYNGAQIKLRDLTGKTLPEINEYLRKMDLEANIIPFVDNSKEMGTFYEYIGNNIGDILNRRSTITLLLYDNDDIYDEKQLFISKYMDIGLGDNGIELYNPLDSAINLSEYYISIFENGSLTPNYEIKLEGILPSKETYVIVSLTSSDALKEKANLISSQMISDGNDVIQLRKTSNNTYIDTVYNVGNTIFTLDDEIFIRRETLTKGSKIYASKEWAGYLPTFLDPIGIHPYEILEFPSFVLLEDIFPNYGMTKVRYLSAADGDTVYLESLDSRDPGPYNGNNRLRFLMVDTPETEKPGVDGEPYAEEASNFTKNALSKAVEIYIQSDPSSGIKDTYGRNLGVIWYNAGTIENPEWHLLNYELVYYGLGQPAGIKGVDYKKSVVWGNRYLYQWVSDATIHAEDNNLGIYSDEYKP